MAEQTAETGDTAVDSQARAVSVSGGLLWQMLWKLMRMRVSETPVNG